MGGRATELGWAMITARAELPIVDPETMGGRATELGWAMITARAEPPII